MKSNHGNSPEENGFSLIHIILMLIIDRIFEKPRIVPYFDFSTETFVVLDALLCDYRLVVKEHGTSCIQGLMYMVLVWSLSSSDQEVASVKSHQIPDLVVGLRRCW